MTSEEALKLIEENLNSYADYLFDDDKEEQNKAWFILKENLERANKFVEIIKQIDIECNKVEQENDDVTVYYSAKAAKDFDVATFSDLIENLGYELVKKEK